MTGNLGSAVPLVIFGVISAWQAAKVEKTAALESGRMAIERLDHIVEGVTHAPEDGYMPTIIVDAEGRPKWHIGEARPLSFVFRVRTVLDEVGKVVSAHYGKIYPEAYKIVYYFNPTENSPSLEFNPKQNLFKDLKSYEHINEQ